MSMPRFVVARVPGVLGARARRLERRRLPGTPSLASFAAGYGVLAVLFINWCYIF